ncbi:MAG: alpha/beta hydrolase [Candidatus Limnocylindrales bacterium]
MATSPLPPPVRGLALSIVTDAGRVAGYQLGEGRTVLLLHSFNAAGCGAELEALATRLAEHRRVIHWFLAQIFADPARIPESYERYCWRTCQQPCAFRAPLAFVSGVLNDPRAEDAYRRVANPTLLVFGDHTRFSDPAAAETLVATNGNLQMATIAQAGDLPQVERPDETAAVIGAFLA